MSDTIKIGFEFDATTDMNGDLVITELYAVFPKPHGKEFGALDGFSDEDGESLETFIGKRFHDLILICMAKADEDRKYANCLDDEPIG